MTYLTPCSSGGKRCQEYVSLVEGKLKMLSMMAPAPLLTGDNISVALSRTANVGAAGYVSEVIVIDICIEYQIDKLGE